jgi:hypothetical protein
MSVTNKMILCIIFRTSFILICRYISLKVKADPEENLLIYPWAAIASGAENVVLRTATLKKSASIKNRPPKNGGLLYSYTIKKIKLSLFRAAARRAIRTARMRAVRAAGLRRLRLLCHHLLLPVAGKSRRAHRQQANTCQFHQ